MAVRINPSILAADFVNLQSELASIAAADFIHVDVMDNHFVPNLTFGQQMVASIQRVTPKPQDVHLMITDVDRWGPEFAKLGAFSVTFHAEATENPVALARQLRSLGARAGVAIKPNTPVEPLLEDLSEFDQFLVMTVEPGFGGQTFMAEMMGKVEKVAARAKIDSPKIWLQVDGGIDLETIKLASAAGADTFVAGSAVFSAADREERIHQLRDIAVRARIPHQH
jgi:ribulose-phosphate 3-epimerase